MKGKTYTPEDKIRILREADTGKSILEVCRPAQHLRGQFPPLEATLWPDGDQRGPSLERAGARERGAKEDARREPAQEPRFGGDMRKKIVSPGHRKQVALALLAQGMCSGRAACRF